MLFKPLSPSAFIRHLKMVGWSLEKVSIDWNLYNENGKFVCTIQISHSSKAKTEVTARSVRKVEREFKTQVATYLTRWASSDWPRSVPSRRMQSRDFAEERSVLDRSIW